MTLKRHHMQLLEAGVAQHHDFTTVFGDTSTRGRHQCAEVKRSARRRWLRLLGTRHDVQIWGPDDRSPPTPSTAMLSGVLSSWLEDTLAPIKAAVPCLAAPDAKLNLVEAKEDYAIFYMAVEGVQKELVLYRFPAVLNIFNVVEHGRKWVRELVYTSDTARCYGDPVAGGGFTGDVVLQPRPHWTSGDPTVGATPSATLVISRQAVLGAADSGAGAGQIYVPSRHLTGLLPEALLKQFLFWRSTDGSTLTGHPVPKESETFDKGGNLVQKDGDGGAAVADASKPEASARSYLAGKEEITVLCQRGGATVRRTPCDDKGEPIAAEGRRLISTLGVPASTPYGQLVALLERVEDLAHVLVWSNCHKDAPAETNPFAQAAGAASKAVSAVAADATNPFASAASVVSKVVGGAKAAADKSNPFAGGGDSECAVALVEMPRLNFAFDVKRDASGTMRLCSREHPGLYVGTLEGVRATHLLAGLPHALVLLNEEGDACVLLSSLAKPCRLADASSPLSSQLLLSRASKAWLANLPSVTHYLYAVHRSQAFLTPPSLAACLNLLVLKWMARDFEAVFHLAPACATDSALAPDELQLWQSVMKLDDDLEPESHACRLRLSLATRSCSAMVEATSWDVGKQLALYLAKLAFIPAACQLAAPDELTLLREHGASLPETRARVAFLDAALDAALAQEAAEHMAANNPFASAGPPAPTLAASYPPRPKYVEFDGPIDPTAALMAPEALAGWQKKLGSISYSRPDEVSGLAALKLLSEWMRPDTIKVDADGKGFWFIYELLTNAINVKILMDDSSFCLGGLLLRLAAKGHGEELLPILRLMEANQAFANEMPKFKDNRGKGIKLFKGKAGKGMPEEIHTALTSLLPRLPDGGRKGDFTLFSPPASLPMPPLRELRAVHRTWLNPTNLGHAASERPVPQAFVPQGPPDGATLVLALLDPMTYVRPAAGGGHAGGGADRPPSLTVDRHPAAQTVVARKMLKRIQEDVQWMLTSGKTAPPPKLGAFEVEMGGAALPRADELQQRAAAVQRLAASLDQLYTQDMKAADERFPQVQALVIEGGMAAPDAVRRARSLAQLAGCELRPSMELLCALLMSANAEAELKVLNPLLTDAEVERVLLELTGLLLTISRAQLLSKALVLCRKLLASLGMLVGHARAGGTPPPSAMHLAADAQALADQLGAMIITKRSHVQLPGAGAAAPPGVMAAPTSAAAILDPRILVFEFCSGVVLRPPQVHLIAKLTRLARSGGSVCHQMLMGEGKTTVVSPLIALMLADGTQLVMQVVPAPLLRFTLQVMRSVFRSGPLRKTIATFTFDRRTEVSETLLLAAHLAVQGGAVMVSTPASVKAFLLKLLELLHLLDTGQYPRLHSSLGKNLRKLFGMKAPPDVGGIDKPSLQAQAARAVQLLTLWRGAVAVIDEVDIVLHPLKSELNWPLGDRHPLDFNPTRWEMPWYLLNGLLMAVDWKADAGATSPSGRAANGSTAAGKEATVLQRLHTAIATGLELRVMQRVPHLILLSDAFYVHTIKPIMADWLLLWLRRHGLRDVTDEQALRCLTSGAVDAQVQHALSDQHVKMINLGADWLGFLLPHAIRKISRVHYGLLKPHEMAEMKKVGGLPRSRRYLAVPFVGKDAPSHASEFAHPDVAIGVTILAYRYEGLRVVDFGPALRMLRVGLDEEVGPILQRPSSLMWIQWMQAAGKKVRATTKMLAFLLITSDPVRTPSESFWVLLMSSVSFRQVRGTKKMLAATDPGVAVRQGSFALKDDGGLASPGRAMPGAMGAAGGGPAGAGAMALPPMQPNVAKGNSDLALPTATATMTDAAERGLALDAVVGVDVSEGSTDILPLHLLDISDVEYMSMLFELLAHKPEPIRFYLEELVFPDTTAHQPMKLSANGQDVGGEMLFSRRIAFSGTPSSLLPLEMGDCVYQLGDDAKMLRTLTDPSTVCTQDMPTDWDVPALLEAVVAHQPPAHALIDTGALVTGMSNKEVAHFLLARLPSASFDGVVYLEPGGHKKILMRGAAGTASTMDLERCGMPKERRFSFFDQVHTTGMDIPQGASARAVLTLGKDLMFRDYAQGAYRMRGIGKGQTIALFVIPEVSLRLIESA